MCSFTAYATNTLKKRFIAGATCPQCRSFDSLYLYFENNVEKLACAQCSYQKSQVDDTISKKTRDSENVIGIFKPSDKED
ncbi:MAG: YheV family putative zinc ribbon protein [Aestuariibacter sp.]